MKKITQEEFENFPVNESGFKICISGDYTEIKHFGDMCCFDSNCIFGIGCNFGNFCYFLDACSFECDCTFGNVCHFENSCKFNVNCIFNDTCYFDDYCIFENGCIFGIWCDFGECCEFGDMCIFKGCCNFEESRVKGGKYFTCNDIGDESEKTYFFIDENKKIFVRNGDFFGTKKEFIKKIKQDAKNRKIY